MVIEDEEKLRRVIQLQLESNGHKVDGAPSAEQAMPLATVADLVLTDLRLPGMDGLQFIGEMHARGISAPVVVMTAHGSVEMAVQAMKLGAADFLQKPFSLDHLTTVVAKVLAVQSLRTENTRLREQLDQRYQFDNIIGRSGAMREIFQTIERVAPTAIDGTAGGRERSRKGHDRASDPSALAEAGAAVRQDRLHGAAGEFDGKRAVRV